MEMKSEHDAFTSSGLSLCGNDGRYAVFFFLKVAEVKLEAGPLPWQDMNHRAKASTALIQQQLREEMSMPIYVTKACGPQSTPAPLPPGHGTLPEVHLPCLSL